MNDKMGAKESEAERGLEIISIYAKDISFESPNAPSIFQEATKHPETNINIELITGAIGENTYEVILKMTITAKVDEKTAYLVEIHQAGIFGIIGFEGDELKQMIGIYCPNVLFPFAREAIADLIRRGGFPQVLLKPVNFEALYNQNMQQQEAAQQSKNATH